jgi:hypothetical protein
MQYSRFFRDNEAQATINGTRDIVTYDEVMSFIGNTDHDDTTELLMDILNGIYSVEDCIKDVKEYK